MIDGERFYHPLDGESLTPEDDERIIMQAQEILKGGESVSACSAAFGSRRDRLRETLTDLFT